MAKLVCSIILFSVLLTVSYARFSLDHPENEEIGSVLEPMSSDHPESEEIVRDLEPLTTIDLESYSVNSKSEPEQETTEIPESTEAVPLTIISFRPINHNFPLRHRHNCRHGRREIRPWVGPREIPYGNDMISSGENYLRIDPPTRDGQIPARWEKFSKHDDEDDEKDHHHHHHFFRHHFMSHFRHHDHEMGGFMSKIRKFLGQAV